MSADGLRACVSCNNVKPYDEFRQRSRNKDGLELPRSVCKSCEAAEGAEYRKQNPEKHTQAKRAWEAKNPVLHEKMQLRSKARILGLDPAMILKHFEDHHGNCDICDKAPVGTKKDGRPRMLSIDHCHETGAFRGLLCSECNFGLGKFKDDPELLLAAVEYLRKVEGPVS